MVITHVRDNQEETEHQRYVGQGHGISIILQAINEISEFEQVIMRGRGKQSHRQRRR